VEGGHACLFDIGPAGSVDFLSALLGHTPAPTYVTSVDYRYLYVNPAWEAVFGIPRRQVIGRPALEVIPPESVAQLSEANRRVVATGQPVEVEEVIRTPRGVLTHHAVRFPIRDERGAVIAVGGVSLDVTERRRMDETLRDSEARLRHFFDAAFEGIVLHEAGVILDANQVMADMLGYSLGELIGRHAMDFTAPEFRELVMRKIRAGDERPYESVGLRRDGSTIPLELCGKSISYRGRAVRATVARDLTERRRAEALRREYARRLQSLSRRLLVVQEEERRFLSRELHDEIGQILTGLSFTLGVADRLDGRGVHEAVREARGLVQDLAGRVHDLSLRLRPTMLDDLGLVPALLWLFERYTAQTRVRVHFQHKGLEQRLDPQGETAAYRIVQEALTNIARHAGVPEAQVRIVLDGAMLRLQIEDRGAGFNSEAVLASGACCGLAGMRQRAALLGGRLDLTSRPGAGTRLAAEWPADGAGVRCAIDSGAGR
jgi:PAS domain S-box-containing protein